MIEVLTSLNGTELNTTLDLVRNLVITNQDTFILSWDIFREFAFYFGGICMVAGAGIWELTRFTGKQIGRYVAHEIKENEKSKDEKKPPEGS